MFELVAVLAVVGAIIILVTAVAFVGFLLKMAFKLVLLPFWILGAAAKGAFYLGAGLLTLVALPILFVLFLLLLPFAAFAGLVGTGIWILA